MRIAMVSTPFVAVPPQKYGGTELVVADLVNGLTERGHSVSLYATGNSQAKARVRSMFQDPVWPPDAFIEWTHVSWAIQDIIHSGRDFDVIHAHCASAMAFSPYLPIPMVYTLHHVRDGHLSRYYTLFPKVHYVTITDRQQELEIPLRDVQTIYHGLSPHRYPFNPDPSDYLAFIGRFAPYKGPHVAINVAQRAGVPLRIAGVAHWVDQEWYLENLRDRLHDDGVTYIGEADHDMKIDLLGNARATLFPIDWEEPFGLVMIESMLCGTPVIAYPRGSVPEVVEEGLTGFLVRNEAEMVEAVRRLPTLDRRVIRARAVERFGSDRMVRDYLALYQRAALEHQPPVFRSPQRPSPAAPPPPDGA